MRGLSLNVVGSFGEENGQAVRWDEVGWAERSGGGGAGGGANGAVRGKPTAADDHLATCHPLKPEKVAYHQAEEDDLGIVGRW